MLKYTGQDSLTPTANPQTLFQLFVPSGQRAEVPAVEISLQGATPASTPVRFEWLIQTSAGTASALTGQKQDRGSDETIQATMLKTFTVEPTAGAVIIAFSMHQQGVGFWRPPPGHQLICKGGERIGLRYVSGTFVPVTITVHIVE